MKAAIDFLKRSFLPGATTLEEGEKVYWWGCNKDTATTASTTSTSDEPTPSDNLSSSASPPRGQSKKRKRGRIFQSTQRSIEEDPTVIAAQGRDPAAYFGRFLVMSVLEDNPSDLRRFLFKGADPNYTTEEGFTPLYLALTHELLECAEVLMDHGALLTKEVFIGGGGGGGNGGAGVARRRTSSSSCCSPLSVVLGSKAHNEALQRMVLSRVARMEQHYFMNGGCAVGGGVRPCLTSSYSCSSSSGTSSFSSGIEDAASAPSPCFFPSKRRRTVSSPERHHVEIALPRNTSSPSPPSSSVSDVGAVATRKEAQNEEREVAQTGPLSSDRQTQMKEIEESEELTGKEGKVASTTISHEKLYATLESTTKTQVTTKTSSSLTPTTTITTTNTDFSVLNPPPPSLSPPTPSPSAIAFSLQPTPQQRVSILPHAQVVSSSTHRPRDNAFEPTPSSSTAAPHQLPSFPSPSSPSAPVNSDQTRSIPQQRPPTPPPTRAPPISPSYSPLSTSLPPQKQPHHHSGHHLHAGHHRHSSPPHPSTPNNNSSNKSSNSTTRRPHETLIRA
ncbi:BRCA1-associated RING domain protein 1 [Balamuthia mandrillaris]